ncbi:MAG: NAD(P)H-binding protein, partial [Trueperaceae bacterium]
MTGATGYLGGRLVPDLLDAGLRVRCLVRDRERLASRPWRDRVEVVEGDALEAGSLEGAFDGVRVAYHLIHAMGGSERGFEDRDRVAARNAAAAAAAAGVERLV